MKRLLTLAAAVLALSATASAQSRVIAGSRSFARAALRPTPPATASVSALVSDTLYPDTYSQPCGDSIKIYYSSDSAGVNGYLNGTNGYGDLEKGQAYLRPGSATVTGVVAYVPFATSATNPDLHAAVYAFDNSGGFPDEASRVESDPKPLTSLPLISGQTFRAGFITFSFANPVAVADSFVVMVTVPDGTTAGDTVTIASTRIGCSSDKGLSYERWEDGTLNDIRTTYSDPSSGDIVNFDFWVWPIIQFDDNTTATLATLTQATRVAPVPTEKSLAVLLPANLQGAQWEMIAADGKVARTGSFSGFQTTIDRGSLNGVYTLRMQTTAGPIVKRVIFAN